MVGSEGFEAFLFWGPCILVNVYFLKVTNNIMCGHYSVEWYTHGTLLLGAKHLSLIGMLHVGTLAR